jgi:hypothetical protein
VNRKVRREKARLLGLDAQAFNCRVDLDMKLVPSAMPMKRERGPTAMPYETHRRNVPLPHAAAWQSSDAGVQLLPSR